VKAMKIMKYRVYKCTACGKEKDICTNHTGSCIDYCPNCSWKANYARSFPVPGHSHGRIFEYVKEISGPDLTEEMTFSSRF
jgi:hypothetical protein